MGNLGDRNSMQVNRKIYLETVDKHRVRSGRALVPIFTNLFTVRRLC